MQRIRSQHQAAAESVGRIAFALLVSVALHLALVQQLEVAVPRSEPPQSMLKARLNVEPPSVPPAKRPTRPPENAARLVAVSPPKFSMPAALPAGEPQPQSAGELPSRLAALQPAPEPLIQVPVDPVYYTARELDVYPMPLDALPAVHSSEGGRIRALASIDETGTVSRAELFEADQHSMMAKQAVTMLQAVRFTPAQKGGLPVRSRVLIELEVRPDK